MANVVAFDSRPKVLSESEALDWLRLQPNGRADANTAALGERWGWTRQRVARRLRTWQDAGLINRSGKILIVAIKEAAPVAVKEVAPVASLAAPAAPSDTAHVSLP